MDWRVAAFTAALSMCSPLAAGLLPAVGPARGCICGARRPRTVGFAAAAFGVVAACIAVAVVFAAPVFGRSVLALSTRILVPPTTCWSSACRSRRGN